MNPERRAAKPADKRSVEPTLEDAELRERLRKRDESLGKYGFWIGFTVLSSVPWMAVEQGKLVGPLLAMAVASAILFLYSVYLPVKTGFLPPFHSAAELWIAGANLAAIGFGGYRVLRYFFS